MDIFYFAVPCALLLLIAMFLWQSRRSEEMIRHWAVQGGYQILLMERSLFSRGPFYWTTSRQQTVYRIEVRDSSGQTQKAWVRCGNWWTGVNLDDIGGIKVRWDD